VATKTSCNLHNPSYIMNNCFTAWFQQSQINVKCKWLSIKLSQKVKLDESEITMDNNYLKFNPYNCQEIVTFYGVVNIWQFLWNCYRTLRSSWLYQGSEYLNPAGSRRRQPTTIHGGLRRMKQSTITNFTRKWNWLQIVVTVIVVWSNWSRLQIKNIERLSQMALCTGN
jgi:hypothetical protein